VHTPIPVFLLLSLSNCKQAAMGEMARAESDDGNFKVSGKIDKALASKSISSGGIVISKAPEDYQIVYCYGEDRIIDGGRIKNRETTQINSDGQFSFEIPAGNIFVAFLIDPAEEYRKVVGVIGIGTGSQSYWKSIDAEQIEGDLSLGTIKPDADISDILISENDLQSLSGQIDNPDEE